LNLGAVKIAKLAMDVEYAAQKRGSGKCAEAGWPAISTYIGSYLGRAEQNIELLGMNSSSRGTRRATPFDTLIIVIILVAGVWWSAHSIPPMRKADKGPERVGAQPEALGGAAKPTATEAGEVNALVIGIGPWGATGLEWQKDLVHQILTGMQNCRATAELLL
jgi:hypothetical protein